MGCIYFNVLSFRKFIFLNIVIIVLFFTMVKPVNALTIWNFEDWQAGNNYGSKTKISSNITNLKGEKETSDGMKVGPYNKASKSKLSDGITEEVFVGLDLDNYQNSELFELSIALNQQDGGQSKYLTEAVVMTQKSGDKFVITSVWSKDKNPIAVIDENGVYTYRWEFKRDSGNSIKVRFSVFNYDEQIGTTDFVELKVDNANKATDVRYLWACNIKANYGIDIYSVLPERQDNIENPNTSDSNLILLISFVIFGLIGLIYIIKMRYFTNAQ